MFKSIGFKFSKLKHYFRIHLTLSATATAYVTCHDQSLTSKMTDPDQSHTSKMTGWGAVCDWSRGGL